MSGENFDPIDSGNFQSFLRSFTSRTLAPSVRHCRDVQGWAKERPLVGWLWGKQFTLLHLFLNFNTYQHNLGSFLVNPRTGLGWNVIPRLRECCRQVEAEVVSNSKNKIHQTWGPPFRRALYYCPCSSLKSIFITAPPHFLNYVSVDGARTTVISPVLLPLGIWWLRESDLVEQYS